MDVLYATTMRKQLSVTGFWVELHGLCCDDRVEDYYEA